MTNNETLKEIKRLHSIGFALHYLLPKSKRPLESGWTSGPRKSLVELRSSFRPDLNIGVRTGSASQIGENYLACIDVDIKDPKYKDEAYEKLLEIVDPLLCPEVSSGGGNGSCHLYCVTKKPFKMITVAKHPGWEICIYSEGRQMALPPSIHPSGRKYQWDHEWKTLPLLSFDHLAKAAPEKTNSKKSSTQTSPPNFQFVIDETLDVRWLPDISDKMRNLITKGLWDGLIVQDRSAYLLMASHALLSAGLSRDGVLTVLTDKSTFLGKCAYDHAKTSDRQRAAQWLYGYTLKRVEEERDPKNVFKYNPIAVAKELGEKEALQQSEEIEGEINWKQGLDKTDKGHVRNTLSNVHTILQKSFGERIFRFNQFSKQDEVWETTPWGSKIGEEFQERDIQKIKLWLSRNFGFQPTDDNIWSALVNIADANAYHPIKEYLLGLPEWDGKPRLDFFLEKYLRGHAPLKYMRAVSRKTIVAMVARVFEPGIKFDTMLVLEGSQGLRKSTAIAALAGKPWFTDVNLNLKHKDSIADMSGKWVLEQGEMNVMNAHDVAELKQFLSRDTDRMRPSYGRKSQDYPRQSVFIGTTNEDIYLKDTSGSRRFWPIRVTGDCDIDAILRDRNQIFAEALMRYREGEPIWISDTETHHLAIAQQAERETSDELISVIEDWIESQCNKSDFLTPFDPEMIRMADLFVAPGPFGVAPGFQLKMDMAGQKRVGLCLRKLGYERKDVRVGKKKIKKWVKVAPQDEMSPVGATKNE